VELSATLDPILLDWAARENRIVLSHDVSTMVGFAYDRVKAGQPIPGLFEVNRQFRWVRHSRICSSSPTAVWRESGKGKCCKASLDKPPGHPVA